MLTEEGASVILTDINKPAGQALADEIGAEFVEQDVSEEASWPALVDHVMDRHGRLDVLVNNAGIAIIANLLRTTTESERTAFDATRFTRAASTLRWFRPQSKVCRTSS